MKNIVLITAKPRTGKSTCIKKIINIIGKENCTGFYTEEILDPKSYERTGFKIHSLLDNKTCILSSIESTSKLRISRYGVEIDNFENLVLPVLKGAMNSNKIIIIDEIGPMQMYSDKFKSLLLQLEESNKKIIGTIFYDSFSFIDDFKNKPNVQIVELTLQNRDNIASIIANKFMGETNNDR